MKLAPVQVTLKILPDYGQVRIIIDTTQLAAGVFSPKLKREIA
jgi:hypothetical protein